MARELAEYKFDGDVLSFDAGVNVYTGRDYASTVATSMLSDHLAEIFPKFYDMNSLGYFDMTDDIYPVEIITMDIDGHTMVDNGFEVKDGNGEKWNVFFTNAVLPSKIFEDHNDGDTITIIWQGLLDQYNDHTFPSSERGRGVTIKMNATICFM